MSSDERLAAIREINSRKAFRRPRGVTGGYYRGRARLDVINTELNQDRTERIEAWKAAQVAGAAAVEATELNPAPPETVVNAPAAQEPQSNE